MSENKKNLENEQTEKVGVMKKIGGFVKKNWKKALAGAGIFAAGALTDRVIVNRRGSGEFEDYDYPEVDNTTEENL